MVIHSEKDGTTPVQDAYKIYNSVYTLKDIWIVKDSGHTSICQDHFLEYKSKFAGDKFAGVAE